MLHAPNNTFLGFGVRNLRSRYRDSMQGPDLGPRDGRDGFLYGNLVVVRLGCMCPKGQTEVKERSEY